MTSAEIEYNASLAQHSAALANADRKYHAALARHSVALAKADREYHKTVQAASSRHNSIMAAVIPRYEAA